MYVTCKVIKDITLKEQKALTANFHAVLRDAKMKNAYFYTETTNTTEDQLYFPGLKM